MTRSQGSLATELDFGEVAAGSRLVSSSAGRPMLRLAPAMRLRGPNKYKVLDARRRRAQINARRLLDLMERREGGR